MEDRLSREQVRRNIDRDPAFLKRLHDKIDVQCKTSKTLPAIDYAKWISPENAAVSRSGYEPVQAGAIVASAIRPAKAAKKIAFAPGSDHRHDPEIPCAISTPRRVPPTPLASY